MKVYYLLISLLVFGVLPNTWAQQDTYFHCGQDAYYKKVWESDPQLRADYEQLFESAKHVTYDGMKAKTSFTIPVVFHVIHENGSENITDAQIYDEMEVLNRDYNLQNADYHTAVAGFDTIAADAQINFKLAAIDPNGNCTNGIEHIYSHETRMGDDYSKLDQWPRARYLNVWVVSKMGGGAAGYAYYPTAVDGALFFADGIIILDGYIGRIGTGSNFTSRALTHEIGHFLGLAHCWGSTNEPGVACGDDGIMDTPVTKGWNHCPTDPNQAKICDTNIVENYQNYMEYSYCSVMFTRDQVSMMRNMLQGPSGNRQYLITDSVHHLTGIDLPTVPICAPVADFSFGDNSRIACMGSNVQFRDQSWNSVVDNRTWTFQDGTPATSTSATQSVQFSSPGWKTVTLTVSNSAGTDTKTIEKAIYVYRQLPEISGVYSNDMNNDNKFQLVTVNPEPNSPGFDISWNGGVGNSACYSLINYKDISNAIQYSNDYFYYLRLGGSIDNIYTPKLDLKYVSGTQLSFDYAYATDAFAETDITEALKVYTSTNCGTTWIPRKTITGADLVTGGNSSNTSFKPSAEQWKTATISLPALDHAGDVLIKFEFTTSDHSNNFYIDNINVNGTMAAKDDKFAAMDINVYPNPSTADQGIYVEYTANNSDVQIELTDMSGKILSTETLTAKDVVVKHKINATSDLKAGIYLVRFSQEGHNLIKKVVIL